jgi:hypothetical protein
MMSNDDLFAVVEREHMKKDNSESEDTLRPEFLDEVVCPDLCYFREPRDRPLKVLLQLRCNP